MSNTPRGAPELTAGQAVPETTVNEQIRHTEAGASYYPVADRVTAPPGSCADGASYIIIATATGAFTGKEGQIATAVGANAGNGWDYHALGAIDEGALAYVQDEDATYKWSGTAWAVATASGALLIANNLSDVGSASTARTNLGATTVGGNVLTLTNPSAISFPRFNADNTVDALSASAFRTAIGAGTGSGSGDLVSTNNLSDVANAATARGNLGLAFIRLAGFATTAPASSEVLLDFVADVAFSLAANLSGSRASVGSNPAATFGLDVQKNGSTIGTISISTGGVATLSTTSGTSKSIAAGDLISVVAPSGADASIARLRFTLQGTL